MGSPWDFYCDECGAGLRKDEHGIYFCPTGCDCDEAERVNRRFDLCITCGLAVSGGHPAAEDCPYHVPRRDAICTCGGWLRWVRGWETECMACGAKYPRREEERA
jgi:hypothetical protein